jgi:integrase/recombinase XerD
VTAVLRLVRESGGGGELPPLERYEIWMRGRGLSERTITDTMLTLRRLERDTGRPAHTVPALAISQFLGAPQLGPSARYTYHIQLGGFFRWHADNDGGTDTMARLPRPRMPRREPRPITTEQLQALLKVRVRPRRG